MEGKMALLSEPEMKFFSNLPLVPFKLSPIHIRPVYFETAEYEIVRFFGVDRRVLSTLMKRVK